ncbi:MAG TPA: hypothetical protein DIU00_16780 [Phycisphaerales bacterium]|nr:hypothetical protein [Phycisphaerales bacterium]
MGIEEENQAQQEDTTEPITFKTFLEEYPTGTLQNVSEFCEWKNEYSQSVLRRCKPTLRLYCKQCDGTRNFEGEWEYGGSAADVRDDFLIYTCRDCGKYTKHFCLFSVALPDQKNGKVLKIGEYPSLHIKLPTNLSKLLGDNYSNFINGLRCERQGLGIGAYSYYRRVVENQKNHLLEEILKVSKKLSAKKEMIQTIEKAILETQFSKAINMVKESLPESLLVGGHNPFKLLHKPLSIGIHDKTDEKCLEMAHNIRMVLIDLAERIKLALSEQRELKSAVSSLLQFKTENKKDKEDKNGTEDAVQVSP